MSLLKKAIADVKKFRNAEVYIYQMGKVGSSSLEASIPNSVHMHTLYGNSPCCVGEKQRNAGIKRQFVTKTKFLLRRFFIKWKKDVKIITVVREPKARNVSMFFQELSYWVVDYINKYNPDMRYVDDDFLLEVFEKTFDHDYYDKWFDREIKRLTGIDVYKKGFDHKKGFNIYKNGRYELMVIRMEDIEKNKNEIEGFINIEFELENVNDGSRKWYANIYKEFKEKLKIRNIKGLDYVSKSRTAKFFGY
ncbi:putative capsular polysaccharide synthesis family protein [Modicisalibacter xianhensis]|uniref:Sulfotransferase domain-containing protein n=1 Tax=Modicisalibacter xianhensis TaxID=442341 RepID=A0A1I2ZC52_9GAMM|nr:putative capsular polysaccharide synthesis family protein [Halomonas xianhensis]SFH35442.1 Sulfotransferase domain-containing protein [Halomonas xianhensis]